MKNIFHGLGIALVTPFKQNGEIDYDALKRMVLTSLPFWQQQVNVPAYLPKRRTNSPKPLSRL